MAKQLSDRRSTQRPSRRASRQIGRIGSAAAEAFQGLSYPIEKYVIREGDKVKPVFAHTSHFRLHALRHLRPTEPVERGRLPPSPQSRRKGL